MARSPTPDSPLDVVLRGGALGDFVLTLPAIATLRAPDRRLLIVGDPARAALARPDAVIDAGSQSWSRLFSGAPLDAQLAERLSGCDRVLAYLAGGEPSAPRLVEGLRRLGERVVVFDPRPPSTCTGHVSTHLMSPLASLGVAVPLEATPRLELASEGPVPSKNLVIVHPGSGGAFKCWPAAGFTAILDRLGELQIPAAVLWGPAEEERASPFGEAFLGTPRLSPPSPLALAEALRGARLYVGNDSGPGHLAAAVGTPSLSLFGPTDPGLWRPLGPRARVLQAPQGDLARLQIDEVLAVLSELLAEAGP